MLPVLREIVEILFARGYIKLLFATETVAIGLNLPVKTCIFTDIYKHDGTELRILQAHEYTQAAGRAGRLGLDTVGHVFHLNNLFRDTGIISYKTMMNGTPQILVSRFKFSYHFLLSLNDTNNTNNTNKLTSLINNSMTKQEISTDLIYLENNIKTVKKEVEAIQEYVLHSLKTPKEAIEEYISLQHIFIISVNKKRKEIERKIATLLDTHRFMEVDKTSYERLKIKENELVNLEQKYNNTNSYINKTIQKVFELLREEDFINKVNYKIDTEDTESLESTKGSLVNYLKEVPCLIFAEIIHERKIVSFSPIELVELFGCFTNIKVQEDYKNLNPKTSNANAKLESLLIHISSRINYYKDRENEIGVQTGDEYNLNYDLLVYLEKMCNSKDIHT
jgi:superfamily II RNA helicase